MKKISLILTLGLLFCTTNTHLIGHSDDSTSSVDFDDDDDFFGFDSSLNFNPDILANHVPIVQKRSIATNTDTWAALLLSLGDNNIILNQSLYQYTSPIRTRSILDYPFALTYGFDLQDTNACTVNFYGNIAWPKNFTKNSQHLSSYLNTNNQDIIDILEDILNQNPSDDTINIGEAFSLFSPGKVVELRAGALLETHIARNKWNIMMQLPFQYVARSIYFTQAEQDLIYKSQLATYIELDQNIDDNQFYYENFYADEFGIGDLKIKAMYLAKESKNFDLNVGGFVILPITKAIQQGVYGNWFPQNNERAYLDLRTIDPQNVTTANQEDVAEFFIDALQKLDSNILFPLLGNNSHVVVAPSCNLNWYMTQHWKFCGDYSVEIPLRAHEQRFYKAIQSDGSFTTEFNNFVDNDDTNGLVLFANQKIQDMFFPYVFSSLVLPGLIVNSTNQFVVTHEHWDVQFGGNYWYQAKEQITAPVSAANYDLAVVPAASAAQGKLFGKYNYNFDWDNNDWCLSAYTDITVWNSGIGNDYTLGLSVDCKF